MSFLVLLDVDGTLSLGDDMLVGHAFVRAADEVFGVQLPDGSLEAVDHPGATALSLARELLERAGLETAAIDGGLERWCALANSVYLELLARARPRRWESPPGTADALRQLEQRALLTGLPEPIARARIDLLGLSGFFPLGGGAFGCERERRPALIELARARAGGWPRARTVAVGDTPRDIEGARAAGVRVVAVLTGRYGEADLAGADATVPSVRELPVALERLPSA